MRTQFMLGTAMAVILSTPTFVQPAAAQQASSAAPQSVETVTVTARKREEKAFDIPDAVTAFSPEKSSNRG
jgi:outer membrane receptor protein involved in Fe transport